MKYTQTIYKRDGKRFVYEINVPWYVWYCLFVEELCRPLGLGLVLGSSAAMLVAGYSNINSLMLAIGFLAGVIGVIYPVHNIVFGKVVRQGK